MLVILNVFYNQLMRALLPKNIHVQSINQCRTDVGAWRGQFLLIERDCINSLVTRQWPKFQLQVMPADDTLIYDLELVVK